MATPAAPSSPPPPSTSPPPTSGPAPSTSPPPTSSSSPSAAPAKKSRKPYTITKPRESWTKEEHQLFLDALKLYERDWKQIGQFIQTKSIIQIRSHAQKYFIKMSKMGLKEAIPPPRPKKRSKRPYPKSSSRSKRKRGDGDDDDDDDGSSDDDDSSDGSGSDNSDSSSAHSGHPSANGAGAEAIKAEDTPTPPKAPTRPPSSRLHNLAAASHAFDDASDAPSASDRRRSKKPPPPQKGRGKKRTGRDRREDSDSASPASPPSPPATHPPKRRRGAGAAPRSPPLSPHMAGPLPLGDLPPSSSSYSHQWMEGDEGDGEGGEPLDFDASDPSAPLPSTPPADGEDGEDGDQPGSPPLRLHPPGAIRDMSHFAALSQLSPVSQLSQAADLVGGQPDDGMQLGGDEAGVEGGVEGVYGPFQEDFQYPAPLPALPPYTHGHNTRRASALHHTPLRQLSPHPRHRAAKATPAPATPASRPEFSKVYAFLGSFFDPSTSGHSEDLESMTPINREMVKALMHNLAVNLHSSTGTGMPGSGPGEGGGRDPLLGPSTVPSPLPLSFSSAPEYPGADSPAHRYSAGAGFFQTPVGGKRGETPPPVSGSAMFTPQSQATRPGVQVNTPSDFLTSTPMTVEGQRGQAEDEVSESRAALFGTSSALSLNLSPSGAMPLPSLDSPSVRLLSPLGGSVMSEASRS